MRTCQLKQPVLRQAINDAADVAPVDRAGTHAARLSAAVKGAPGQALRRQRAGSQRDSHEFGMLGWIALRRHRVVAGSGDDFPVFICHQRGEGVAPLVAGSG